MFSTSLLAVVIAIVVALSLLSLFWKLFTKSKNAIPLPPGPKGLPIVGNILDLPAKGAEPGLHWLKHKDLYGMCGFHVTPFLVCARAKAKGLERPYQFGHSTRPAYHHHE
jgi:hypothetical protein